MDQEIVILADLTFELDKEAILASIDCREHSSAYEQLAAIYDRLIEQYGKLIAPKAAYMLCDTATAQLTKYRQTVYCLVTIGEAIAEQVRQLFHAGHYAEGLVADAIANHALFDCSRQLYLRIACAAQAVGLGLSSRLSPGEGQLDIALQCEIVKRFADVDALGISMTDAYMLKPIKSLAYVYGADKGLPQNFVDHDCSLCSRQNCNLREANRQSKDVDLTVVGGRHNVTLRAKTTQTILTTLSANGIDLYSPCGGRGTCGKCKVKVLSGQVTVDKLPNLSRSVQLACRTRAITDCTIDIRAADVVDFQSVTGYKQNAVSPKLDIRGDKVIDVSDVSATARPLGVAIDIGTTTVVLAVVDLIGGHVLQTQSLLNSQRKFGADIISRIAFSVENLATLRSCICKDIINCILGFAEEIKSAISQIVIAGNTTMLHFLLGLSAQSLGRYPFQPVTTGYHEYSFAEVFGDAGTLSGTVSIMPGISAFVGADIVAGMLHCGFAKRERVAMLVDIGTNGEIAIGNKARIICLATAAGPAFEGANISCGVGSINGAISKFVIKDNKSRFATINGAEPIGVCGSGIIDIMAACIETGGVDATGKLNSNRFPDGRVPIAQTGSGEWLYFTQKDIRELQLAKAAIRAGINIIISRYGSSLNEIDDVFLAGSFGSFLNIDSAVKVGIIPQELKDKVRIVGNSALGGAVRFMLNHSALKETANLTAVAASVDLATEPEFNEQFMKRMYF